MTVAFYILSPHNGMFHPADVSLSAGDYRPTILHRNASFGWQAHSIVVRNALSAEDASSRFVSWVSEAGWNAVDVLIEMNAHPYDIHSVATLVASQRNDWRRPFAVVQRVQDMYISSSDLHVDSYRRVEFRFLNEHREPGDPLIVATNTPVLMRDGDGVVGTTPFSSFIPALAKTGADVWVASAIDTGSRRVSQFQSIEWAVDRRESVKMRVFDNPGALLFMNDDNNGVVVHLPEGEPIIGIDIPGVINETPPYLSRWEWVDALLERSMAYMPHCDQPSISLSREIENWLFRYVRLRDDDFDRSLATLRAALIDVLDVEKDIPCDEAFSCDTSLFEALRAMTDAGFDSMLIARKTVDGILIRAFNSDDRSRGRTYFVFAQ